MSQIGSIFDLLLKYDKGRSNSIVNINELEKQLGLSGDELRREIENIRGLLERLVVEPEKIEIKTKVGRKSFDDFASDRVKLLKLLIEEAAKRKGNPRDNYIDTDILADILPMDKRTLQKNLDDLIDLFEDIRQVDNKIILGCNEMFYYKNKSLYLNEKKRVSRKFLEVFKNDYKNSLKVDSSARISGDKLPSLVAGCGTTVTACIEALFDSDIKLQRILSNNLALERSIRGREINFLEFTGGRVDPQIYGTTDSIALTSYKNDLFNACVLGVSGITKEGDLSVAFSSEKIILKQIIDSTKENVYFVAGAHKFSSRDDYKFDSIDEIKEREPINKANQKRENDLKITLITTHPDDLETPVKKTQAEVVISSLKNKGVRVFCAEKK